MVTKNILRISAEGEILETKAVERGGEQIVGNNEHQLPNNSAHQGAGKVMHLSSFERNEVDVDNNIIGEKKCEQKSSGTIRRSSRQKRPRVFKDAGDDNGQNKYMKLDLTDVPMQTPILKRHGKVGYSKYQGVSRDIKFSKNLWSAQIAIGGQIYHIGFYDDEEEAAIDYARALYKYAGGGVKQKIDLTGVPEQPLILKPNGKGNSASKYQGVHFNKLNRRWMANIIISGKQYYIGTYHTEENAAADYARAMYKYRGWSGGSKPQQAEKKIDLTGVEEQKLILKPNGKGNSSSKYVGVHFNKEDRKWRASIMISGKNHYIGSYHTEEKAAQDYARAAFKYL